MFAYSSVDERFWADACLLLLFFESRSNAKGGQDGHSFGSARGRLAPNRLPVSSRRSAHNCRAGRNLVSFGAGESEWSSTLFSRAPSRPEAFNAGGGAPQWGDFAPDGTLSFLAQDDKSLKMGLPFNETADKAMQSRTWLKRGKLEQLDISYIGRTGVQNRGAIPGSQKWRLRGLAISLGCLSDRARYP